MKLAGKDSHHIPFLHLINHPVYNHVALALFYGNDLHFLMPVESHILKIPRNGTGIDIKREFAQSVLLGFMVLFLPYHIAFFHAAFHLLLIVLYYILPSFCKIFSKPSDRITVI